MLVQHISTLLTYNTVYLLNDDDDTYYINYVKVYNCGKLHYMFLREHYVEPYELMYM